MKPDLYALAALTLSLGLAAPAPAQNDAGTPPATNSAPENRPIPHKFLVLPTDAASGQVRTARSTYQPGQPVAIAFTIVNVTDKAITYDFPSAQQYDITISDARGAPVWDWAKGQAFAQSISHLDLKSHQKRTFDVAWNGHDALGKPAAPGLYTISARTISSEHRAITGSLLVDPDTDPMNTGFPTRSPAENGAVREVSINPPITATATVTIAAPTSKNK